MFSCLARFYGILVVRPHLPPLQHMVTIAIVLSWHPTRFSPNANWFGQNGKSPLPIIAFSPPAQALAPGGFHKVFQSMPPTASEEPPWILDPDDDPLILTQLWAASSMEPS
jgi:hypothetical protein